MYQTPLYFIFSPLGSNPPFACYSLPQIQLGRGCSSNPFYKVGLRCKTKCQLVLSLSCLAQSCRLTTTPIIPEFGLHRSCFNRYTVDATVVSLVFYKTCPYPTVLQTLPENKVASAEITEMVTLHDAVHRKHDSPTRVRVWLKTTQSTSPVGIRTVRPGFSTLTLSYTHRSSPSSKRWRKRNRMIWNSQQRRWRALLSWCRKGLTVSSGKMAHQAANMLKKVEVKWSTQQKEDERPHSE